MKESLENLIELREVTNIKIESNQAMYTADKTDTTKETLLDWKTKLKSYT